MSKYIITGAPGTGKTTLLESLRCAGYACSGEISRRLIIEETTKGSSCLPWIDLPCFAGRALDRMIGAFAAADDRNPVFFDRGIPDIIAYLRNGGSPVTDRHAAAAHLHRYDPIVFLLPPWKKIYIRDPQRWQTFAEAVQIDRHLREAYTEYGYQILELPISTVADRVLFIQYLLSQLKSQAS